MTPEQLISAQALGSGATLFTIFPTPSSSEASVHRMVASGRTLQHLVVVLALCMVSGGSRIIVGQKLAYLKKLMSATAACAPVVSVGN